ISGPSTGLLPYNLHQNLQVGLRSKPPQRLLRKPLSRTGTHNRFDAKLFGTGRYRVLFELNFKAASGISPRAPPLVASHLICADPNVRLVNGNVQCFRSTGTATYDDGDQPEPSGHGECGDRVGDPCGVQSD